MSHNVPAICDGLFGPAKCGCRLPLARSETRAVADISGVLGYKSVNGPVMRNFFEIEKI
ncbi:MAG: hypothetical protein LBC53_06120 [Spirochaetaceae bacterium]|nr:hypothetical protein [Spirochaetaceae bacterium]